MTIIISVFSVAILLVLCYVIIKKDDKIGSLETELRVEKIHNRYLQERVKEWRGRYFKKGVK